MFISNDLFCSVFPLVLPQNIFSNKDKNQIITLNKINNFGSYLAGLIEGEGSLFIPESIRNNKGKLNQAKIEIVLLNMT